MNSLCTFILVVTVAASCTAHLTADSTSGLNVNGAVIPRPLDSVRTYNGLNGWNTAGAFAPGYTRSDLAAHNYLSSPALYSRSILDASGVSPNILADPYISSRRVLGSPAYSHYPYIGAPGIAPNSFSARGIAPTYFGGSVPRLGYNLNGYGHGLHGLGY